MGSEDPPDVISNRLAETFHELTWLESEMRVALEEESDFWVNRPIVMGVGVVTGRRVPPEALPENMDPVILLDRPKLPRLVTHIDQLFDYYTTPDAQPVEEWGDQMISDLTKPTQLLGSFLDEAFLLDTYAESGYDLDGLVETAA